MNKKLQELFATYQKENRALSIEDEEELIAQYVYSTNRLEGNQLSLSNTKSIIQHNMISDSGVRLRDVLEQRGTHKALVRMLRAVAEKEPLTIALIKELNWLLIGSLFNEDFYNSYKNAGQKYGDFKIKNNKIEIVLSTGKKQIIEPLSTPENAEMNLQMVLQRIENSKENCINKASFLAQEIWLQQPFVDGNKRTGRLLINYLLMREGYPLFTYNKKGIYFNDILVRQYLNREKGLLAKFIENAVINRLEELVGQKTEQITGYRYKLS